MKEDIQHFTDVWGMKVRKEKQLNREYLILKHTSPIPIADEFVTVITKRGYGCVWVDFEEREIAFEQKEQIIDHS